MVQDYFDLRQTWLREAQALLRERGSLIPQARIQTVHETIPLELFNNSASPDERTLATQMLRVLCRKHDAIALATFEHVREMHTLCVHTECYGRAHTLIQPYQFRRGLIWYVDLKIKPAENEYLK